MAWTSLFNGGSSNPNQYVKNQQQVDPNAAAYSNNNNAPVPVQIQQNNKSTTGYQSKYTPFQKNLQSYGSLFQGIGGLAQGYSGYKLAQLGQKQFEHDRNLDRINYKQQADTYNMDLQTQQRNYYANKGEAVDQQAVDDFMNKHRAQATL